MLILQQHEGLVNYTHNLYAIIFHRNALLKNMIANESHILILLK